MLKTGIDASCSRNFANGRISWLKDDKKNIEDIRSLTMSYTIRGLGLYNASQRKIASLRGQGIYDSDNRRVGMMRGNDLFDTDNRKLMSINDHSVFDAHGERVASRLEAERSIEGTEKGMLPAALWYCFIR
jgi:hypothetical protein